MKKKNRNWIFVIVYGRLFWCKFDRKLVTKTVGLGNVEMFEYRYSPHPNMVNIITDEIEEQTRKKRRPPSAIVETIKGKEDKYQPSINAREYAKRRGISYVALSERQFARAHPKGYCWE